MGLLSSLPLTSPHPPPSPHPYSLPLTLRHREGMREETALLYLSMMRFPSFAEGNGVFSVNHGQASNPFTVADILISFFLFTLHS